MNIPEFNEIIEPNDQTEARRAHLEALRELVGNVYPNKFDRSCITGVEDTISNVLHFAPISEVVAEIKAHVATLAEREKPDQELKDSLNRKLKELGTAKVSGRLTTTPRTMGKAAFVHLSDGVNRLQIYVRRDDVQGIYNGKSEPPASAGGLNSTDSDADTNPSANADGSDTVSGWDLFKLLDGGDFVGVSGFLFLTNTGELSIHVETLQFLSKALLPLPDKMHGIADPELQRRYRYADLIASSLQIEHEGLTTREVFERRAKLISGMRRFLDDHDYIEVETPMLTPKATGAAAKPFQTHHNALDITLYARIAPELYLKRLTVGGFEKVYELNRNFRNEGLSQRHNPEFTMLEFYCAYMDVNGMMDFAEEMIQESVKKATGGSLQVKYGENEIDFSKFERWTMKKAIAENWKPEWRELGNEKFEESWLDDINRLSTLRNFVSGTLEIPMNTTEIVSITPPSGKVIIPEKIEKSDKVRFITSIETAWEFAEIYERQNPVSVDLTGSKEAQLLIYLFENVAEEKLIQPTFIIDYPKSISPLSKASPENPQIAERFELFINGMECANGFSELNDPQEQYERFVDQMKSRESGDEEAMVLDEDYIRALAYGMPPAAGIGIGIDRLVMLLTNKHSIRDVILFPHMRPERREHEEEKTV